MLNFVGRNLLTTERLRELCGNQRTVVVADMAIKDLYAVDLAKRIGAELLTITSGEQTKTLGTAQHLIEELLKRGCGRDTVLIAMGGGVTTDLVGFVASVYMRGVSLILVPTTLLAIVDASIGGKTGVNTPQGKNLIGTIYNPKAILADLDTMNTIPEKERFNGLAEILKMGLIYDASILDDPDPILKAIQGKIAVVEKDPTEQGLRRILNFGHTIGHALETVAHYEMSHGEAVAIGCVVEAHLSMQLGYLSKQEFEHILEVYSEFSLRLPKAYARDKLLSAMTHDKKNASGNIRFVLIDRIGHAIPFGKDYCRAVLKEELEPTLEWMEYWR